MRCSRDSGPRPGALVAHASAQEGIRRRVSMAFGKLAKWWLHLQVHASIGAARTFSQLMKRTASISLSPCVGGVAR